MTVHRTRPGRRRRLNMRRSREAAIPCLRGTRDHTRQRPDTLPMVLPDEPDEFVDHCSQSDRTTIASTSSCNSSGRTAGGSRSPPRVPARVFSRVLRNPESLPSLSRVPSESSPSPVRVFVEAKNHQKRLGKTRPSPFPSPPSRLKRAKHDAEAQESIKARRNRIHPARHAKRQSAPLLNQIKEEPKPEVTEPFKQGESQELSKLPDEEQPDRYRDLVRSDSVEVAREIKCRSKSSAHVGCFVA